MVHVVESDFQFSLVPGKAPHEIARKPFGSVTIANADAGAHGFMHAAIDEAYRAAGELRV